MTQAVGDRNDVVHVLMSAGGAGVTGEREPPLAAERRTASR
jgi:hypothetical protein